MLAQVLNERLVTPLRVEIVSVETQGTGQVNLGDFIDVVETTLTELEKSPASELPRYSRWEAEGMTIEWLARQRLPHEPEAPVVSWG